MLGSPNEGVPQTLLEALREHNVDALRQLMKALSIPKPQPTRKADMVHVVAERMADDALLRDIWAQLDAPERMAVRETIHGDGKFNAVRFQAKHGALPNGLGRRTDHWRRVGTASDGLRLLFVPSYRDGPLAFVPADLAARLREFASPPPEAALRTTEELPETVSIPAGYGERGKTRTLDVTVRHMERAAANDLRAVVRLVSEGAIAVSAKTRRPSAAAVRRIAQVLHGGDFYDPFAEKKRKWDQVPGPIRAFAWPWLLQASGLARLQGARLDLTRKGRESLTLPAHRVLRGIWQQWCASSLLDEFSRVDQIKGQQRGKGRRGLTAAAKRRCVIAEALRTCPVGSWVAFDDFGRFMRAASLNFPVTTNPWDLYLFDQNYGSLGYEGSHDWEIIEGRYLLCLLLEYLATIGMVDVAFIPPEGARPDFRHIWGTDDLAYLSRYDGLLHFRLNDLGAHCLGLTEEYEPPSVAKRTKMQVFADRRIVADGSPSVEEAAILETFAAPEADAVWRLDTERIVLALEEGGDLDALRAFLAERDEQPLPETVEGFLERLGRDAAALRMRGAAILIECADADVAAKLMGDSRIAKAGLRAGERHIVVRAKSERGFRNAARAMGYGLRD
ncbi:MAG: helicase-associated domain-containing protein [Gammaproteobacteria bacterium]|nr:helicase-associated domain-containing protein [Gammaproteobacteria bacterium]